MTCKDCIHAKVCDNLISQGLPWEDGKYPAEKWCGLFKNKADVVEVVRCKDCKYLKYGYQCYSPLGINLSNDGDAYVLVDPEDDFCSGAERREDTE